MRDAVFLDRDGVINVSALRMGIPTPPRSLSQVKIIDGVIDAIDLLKENNFEVVVVTNQPDVARGIVTKDTVMQINEYLGNALHIDHFYTCFHDDLDACYCRKPKPGLLVEASHDLELNLRSSYMVGDRWRDIAAGQAAGCECFYLNYEYQESRPNLPFTEVNSLIDAVHIILEKNSDTKN